MIKSIHKYINQHPVKESDNALILGTIHPHLTDNFQIDFFYGNRNSIWNILALAFPNLDFSSKKSIISTLTKYKIWISDLVSSCERQNEKVTQDKLLENIELNRAQIIDGIIKSKISKIYFTSGFGKNNAAKLFCEMFSIRPDYNEAREFEIPESVFGRKMIGVVLFSPSGQANIGISQNKIYIEHKNQYQGRSKPINQFKIDFYRNAFNNQFTQL